MLCSILLFFTRTYAITNLSRQTRWANQKLRVLGKVRNLGVIFSTILNSGFFYFTYAQILKLRVRNVKEKYFDKFKLNPQSFSTLILKSTHVRQGMDPELDENWDAK